MESPGEYLRREREMRGVSLAKIFEETRVPMKHLKAIEADRHDELHPTFIKGFIRSYCKVLGLDETDAVLRFEVFYREREAEAAAAQRRSAKAAPVKTGKKKAWTPVPALEPFSRLRRPAMIAAAALIIVAAYAISMRMDAPVEVPESQAPAVQAAAEGSRAVDTAPGEAAPLSARPFAPEAVISGTPVIPPPSAVPLRQAPEPARGNAEKPEAAVAEKPAVAASTAHTLTASAREMVWIKIGIDGGEPVEVLLREGERFTWKASEGFSVLVGNAGGVTITYNGKELSDLGLSGEVVSLTLPSGARQKVRKQEQDPAERYPLPAPYPGGKEILNMPVPADDNMNAKIR